MYTGQTTTMHYLRKKCKPAIQTYTNFRPASTGPWQLASLYTVPWMCASILQHQAVSSAKLGLVSTSCYSVPLCPCNCKLWAAKNFGTILAPLNIYPNILYLEIYLKNTQRSFSSFYERGGHAVAQLVEVLRYKPEGRGFDSRWFNGNF
jgi:hypothetical protein